MLCNHLICFQVFGMKVCASKTVNLSEVLKKLTPLKISQNSQHQAHGTRWTPKKLIIISCDQRLTGTQNP